MRDRSARLPEAEREYCLVLLNGPNPGTSVRLDPCAQAITIGRDANRELPIEDRSASRLHARFWFDGHCWHLEDCGSSNGTKVNALWVDQTLLEPGDLIRIGETLLVFLEEAAAIDPASLRPSVLAGSTSAVRVQATARHEALLENLRGELGPLPERYLQPLYRLATTQQLQTSVARLSQLAVQTLAEATDATEVHVWLTGTNGRLRRAAQLGTDSREDDSTGAHLLARLVLENDEAVLIHGDANRRPALGVPIPGRHGPRGALECFAAQDADAARTLDRADLDFAIAVAHQFGTALENLEHRERLEQANDNLRRQLAGQTRLAGSSPKMHALLEQIQRVAPTTATVLVLGESGTGKELVAQTIHEQSERAAGPFVAVNCAAFNEALLESELFGHEAGAFTGADQRRLGQFERAHLGTIFLDEVGELSLGCQAKLLRLLEGHPFERLGGNEAISTDVRIIAATHRDLRQAVADNSFREDLYYRLRVVELPVPALRERPSDILQLAVAFLDRLRNELGRGPQRFSPAAANAIQTYGWPGNVRELKNAVERAVVLGNDEEIGVADLALPKGELESPGASRLTSLAEMERRHIKFVLQAVDGNKTKACEVLGIGRGTLYNKLQRATSSRTATEGSSATDRPEKTPP